MQGLMVRAEGDADWERIVDKLGRFGQVRPPHPRASFRG
jgi:hypothetical protein